MKLLDGHLKVRMFRILFCVAFIFCTIVENTAAQNHFLGADVRYGHILCNDAKAKMHINSPEKGLSVYWGYNFEGGDYWHSFWKNPSFGVELSCDAIDNAIIGNRFGVLFFIRPSIYKSKSLVLDGFMGLGLSYFSRIHNPYTNPDNIYIGSHLNALINFGFQTSCFVTDHLALCAAIKFSHSSNGQLMRPNNGLNLLQFELGAEYYIRKYKYAVAEVDKDRTKANEINVSLSPAIAHSLYDRRHYFSAAVSVAYSRRFHPCFSYGLSCDFMYNGTNITSPYSEGKLSENFSQGLAATFECRWDAVALRMALGAYIWHGKYQKLPYYERVGLFYYLGKTKSQYVGVSIKAHAASAEYIEWTYGIRLGNF